MGSKVLITCSYNNDCSAPTHVLVFLWWLWWSQHTFLKYCTAFESLTFSFAFIYLIHLQGDKFREAEELFDNLLNDENSALKPDPKMFNMMIYIHKKAGSYEKARKTFALMAELGIQQTTVTYNSLMSFETNYIWGYCIWGYIYIGDLKVAF